MDPSFCFFVRLKIVDPDSYRKKKKKNVSSDGDSPLAKKKKNNSIQKIMFGIDQKLWKELIGTLSDRTAHPSLKAG